MTTNQLLRDMRAIASSIEDPIKRMKLEKQISFVDITLIAANRVAKLVERIPSSKKKLFKRKNRRPRKKQMIGQILSRIAYEAHTAAIRLNVVAATPIPSYTKGTDFAHGGFVSFFKDEPEFVRIPESFIAPQGLYIDSDKSIHPMSAEEHRALKNNTKIIDGYNIQRTIIR